MEFEWNIFPGFNTLQLGQEVQEFLLRLNENTLSRIGKSPENLTGRIIFMSMFQRHFLMEQKTMKKNASQMLESFSL